MACRVGITTDPERRKKEWQQKHPDLRNWIILGTHSTKSAAQAQENAEAKRRGCVSNPGGAGPEYAVWHVYYFEYTA